MYDQARHSHGIGQAIRLALLRILGVLGPGMLDPNLQSKVCVIIGKPLARDLRCHPAWSAVRPVSTLVTNTSRLLLV